MQTHSVDLVWFGVQRHQNFRIQTIFICSDFESLNLRSKKR